MFETELPKILEQLNAISPELYGRRRNFIDGPVTRLSPYISRGLLSTRFVMEFVLNKGYEPKKIEKFLQELAWRDYWQNVWKEKGEDINSDLKSKQQNVTNYMIPEAIVKGHTGIEAIDKAIHEFYQTGYIHNHVRMYIASLACNIGKSHWKVPAKWMYYTLLDADWASNALSWQWVAGSYSGKKYFASQANINKYCFTNQRNTFLDVDYAQFENMDTPEALQKLTEPTLQTELPQSNEIEMNPDIPTLIYNFYNLDPHWHSELEANRILLLEPSVFNDYAVSDKTIAFILSLSRNIHSIQIFSGEFNKLVNHYQPKKIFYKEHPLNRHYQGNEESRDWMFDVSGYFPSFFKFWNRCKKQLDL